MGHIRRAPQWVSIFILRILHTKFFKEIFNVSKVNYLIFAGLIAVTILFLDREVRQYSLAAVILEEWLHELAAIAQEQSVLQKERVCQINLEISEQKDDNA